MIVLVNQIAIIKTLKAQLMLGFLFFWAGCSQHRQEIQLSGLTMGTTYIIKIVEPPSQMDLKLLQSEIDSVLNVINLSMSTWEYSSEITTFNQWASSNPFPISNHFRKVIDESLDIFSKTNGAFDVTIYDLLSIWGFGPSPKQSMPSSNDIKSVLEYTGSEMISLAKNGLVKTDPRVKLDLNSIAKGYGVDVLFEYLESKGIMELFVEIGGEVRCKGKNAQNRPWSIGIEDSSNDKELRFAGVIRPKIGSVATSGNYRNFVDRNGKIMGHTINPNTGFPVANNILSVSVKSQKCMLADGWATALMVMDLESGLEIIQNQSFLEAMWIIELGDGKRQIICSDGFKVEDAIYVIRE